MAGDLKVGGVLETALYVDDLNRATAFYDDLFGFPHLFENDALIALDVSGVSVLLLFRRAGRLRDGAGDAGRRDPAP